MKRAASFLLPLALIVFASSFALALVPVRATAVEYLVDQSEPQVVNCGSFPFRTQWSGDAGCDRARTRRLALVMYLAVASVAIGAAGAVLLVISRARRQRSSDVRRGWTLPAP